MSVVKVIIAMLTIKFFLFPLKSGYFCQNYYNKLDLNERRIAGKRN
tara:strand:- start:293 stop:430 length:138 start_codon:yes stop_codon:yes gene_type:complete